MTDSELRRAIDEVAALEGYVSRLGDDAKRWEALACASRALRILRGARSEERAKANGRE